MSMTRGHSWEGFLPKRSIVMVRAPGVQVDSAPVVSDSLDAVADEVSICTRCRLCEGRKQTVPGEGSSRARLMFVGAGPGEAEDLVGRYFVGQAGELLDKMIAAIGLTRAEVFTTNVVK